MTDRIDDLRGIFSRLGGEGRFTEPQQQARGSVRSEAAVDRDLRAVVAELRERGLRTTLSDDDLVRVVRGFYADRSDRDLAADLDVPRRTVERVRRVLDARGAARRVNYRYTTEFADLLDGDTARIELDRQVWDDRRALVEAHDD